MMCNNYGMYNNGHDCSIGRLEEAEAIMREAITVMPENPHFYYTLGVLLGKMNHLKLDVRRYS